jgi:hypothetical protein
MTESRALHISAEDMRRYANGTLGEADRERVDAELLECGQCLELLMNVMDGESRRGDDEARERPLPDLQAMEDRVIAELMLAESSKPPVLRRPAILSKSDAKRVSWIQRSGWQYTIAASITLLLLASGALAGFSQSLEKLDESKLAMPSQSEIDNAWSNQPSWSEQLVNRTGGWLDGIQASRFK